MQPIGGYGGRGVGPFGQIGENAAATAASKCKTISSQTSDAHRNELIKTFYPVCNKTASKESRAR